MPLLSHSKYRAPFGLNGSHRQTIYPTLFRRIPLITKTRERVSTEDGDFLDLDWAREQPSRNLVILSHGLEGSSNRHYIQGMAQTFVRAGWHALAWNFRGCSGEANTKLQSYHSGSIHDLETVISHADSGDHYDCIALIGFSLGGNMTLKLLGDRGQSIHPKVKAAVTYSVAIDLASSAQQLERFENRLYMRRFLATLRGKVRHKIQLFPGELVDVGLDHMRSFRQFDDAYTAPMHGFSNAEDYWQQCSSARNLGDITIPTLLINALDDPFLTPSCYPVELAKNHPYFHLETPRYGGHLGFIAFNKTNTYWSESRALAFLTEQIG